MPTLSPQQMAELDQLRQREPELRYEVHEMHPLVTVLSNLRSHRVAEPLDQGALAFVSEYQELFGLRKASEELRHTATSTDSAGWTHVTYEQSHHGIPVWSGRVTVHIDPDKRVHSISSSVRPNLPDTVQPAIDGQKATRLAREAGHHSSEDRVLRKPRLVIYGDEAPTLAWVLALSGLQPSYEGPEMLPGGWLYFVDAITGAVIRRAGLAKEAAQTSTGLSIRNGTRLTQVTRTLQTWHDPGTGRDQLRDTVTGAADGVEILTHVHDTETLCWDDDPSPLGDNAWNRTTGETSTSYADRAKYQPAEVDVHFHGGQVYQFWRRAPFNRSSFDNAGGDIRLKAHAASTSCWWDGTDINIGDADLANWTFKGGQLDAFAHESTHAVMDTEVPSSGMIYSGQSGAAEESFCDIFGAFSEHNWLFEELITVATRSCLRNLADPGDPLAIEPGHDHYADYAGSSTVPGLSANAHTNCHILNTACYLMTHGGVHHRAGRTPADIPVYPGMDWLAAETIYYRAITEGFSSNHGNGSDTEQFFSQVRSQILLAAEWAYGHDSCQYRTARLAYYAIGLQPTAEPYGPDIAVTPWGAVTHEGPLYQSPDFFVRDAANNPVEPERGVHNRLFLRVRNIGDQTAEGVQVRALYSPYGALYHHEHFREIGLSAPITLNPGQQQDVEFDWDLTNLDEDNGGLWPPAGGAAGIRGYDHFCVRAEVVCPSDVNSCNDTAQHNYTNVALNAGDSYDTAFIICSPSAEECWARLEVTSHLPRTWTVAVEGIASPARIRLKPNEAVGARLRVTASEAQALEMPLDGDVEGLFGPRLIVSRRLPQRALGAFRAELRIDRYSRAGRTFTGRLQGTLASTGRRFSGQVRGKLVDPVAGEVGGVMEGHLLHERWPDHEPIKVEFQGKLRPWRDVSVTVKAPGVLPAGFSMRFQRK